MTRRREVVRGEILEHWWREAEPAWPATPSPQLLTTPGSTRNGGIEGELAEDASRAFQIGALG